MSWALCKTKTTLYNYSEYLWKIKNHSAYLNHSLHKYKFDKPTDILLFTSCAEIIDKMFEITLYKQPKKWRRRFGQLEVPYQCFSISNDTHTKQIHLNNTLSLHIISPGMSSRKFRNIDRRHFIQINDDFKVFWTFEQFRKKRGITSHKVQVVRRLDHLECVHRFSTIPSMYPKSANQMGQRRSLWLSGEGKMPVVGTAVVGWSLELCFRILTPF